MNFANVKPAHVDLSRSLCGSFQKCELETIAAKAVRHCQRKGSWAAFHKECLGLEREPYNEWEWFPVMVPDYFAPAGDGLYRVTYKFLYQIGEHIHEPS